MEWGLYMPVVLQIVTADMDVVDYSALFLSQFVLTLSGR